MANFSVGHWLLLAALACYVVWPHATALLKRSRRKRETDREVLDRLAPRGTASPARGAVGQISSLPTSSNADVQKLALGDFSWAVTAANWFFIGIGALIQDSISAGGYAGGGDQFAGRLVAIAIGASVPVSVLYLVSSNKSAFRFRRALTITAWCLLAMLFYPIFKRFIAGA